MKKFFLCLGLIYAFNSNAQNQVVDLSTGVVNNSTTLITAGNIDDTWTAKTPTSSTYNSILVSNDLVQGYTTGFAANSSAHWVSPHVILTSGTDFGKLGLNGIAGNYNYRMNFTSTGTAALSALLNLNFVAADNSMSSISINGNIHSLSSYGISFNALQTVNISIPASEIVSGTNTVEVIVNNLGSYTGMFLSGNLTINYCDQNILPSLSGSSSFCIGAPLTFTGGSNSTNVAAHYWEITESDASGNVISGGFSWNNWYSGIPGVFTFPSSINAPCGKYYKIKLAIQNACVVWQEVSKVIYINCLPVSDLGADITVCAGTCVTLGQNLPLVKGRSYNWIILPAGTSVGTTKEITVCPLLNTTYGVTVTNTITGCSATDFVNINVLANDPSFSFSNNTANPNYYTLSATPNDLNAFSQAGFGYVWKIEELDANGNAIFLVDNSSCWWTFNPPTTNANNFNGFDHLNNNYSGNITLANCSSPSAGMFLYNHTYRITRGTWNNRCGWRQYAQIASSIRSANGNQMVVYTEDTNAPDVSYLMTGLQEHNAKDQLSIYPNPSNGLFTIEMSNDKKSSVEVYDALGKKVKSFEQTNFRSELDLSGFPKGMYMINIISEGKQISKKIILE